MRQRRVMAWVENFQRSLVVVCLGVSGCIGGVRPVRLSGDEAQRQVQTVQLDSGLNIVIERTSKQDSLGMLLLVDAGARWDPPHKDGLSHLVEHLVFHRRSSTTPRIFRRLEAIGAKYNGWTNFDVTGYYAFAGAKHTDAILSIAHDLVSGPLDDVDGTDVERERGIVEAERGNRQDDTPGQVDHLLASILIGTGPNGARSVSGTRESLKSMSLANAATFARQYYRPSRMTLVLVMPERLRTTPELIRQLNLGSEAASASDQNMKRSPKAPTLVSPGPIKEHAAAVLHPSLWLAWPVAYQTLAERAEAELLAQLANHAIAPGFQSHESVTGGSCELRRSSDVPALTCQINLKDSHAVSAALRDVLAALNRGLNWGPNSALAVDWLSRRWALMRILDAEEMLPSATTLAIGAHVHGNPTDERALSESVARVDAYQLLQRGRQLLREETSYRLLVTPIPVQSGSAIDVGSVGSKLGAASDSGNAAPDLDAPVEAPNLPPSQLHHFVEKNGLEVFLYTLPETRFVAAQLGFRGGRAWATARNVGRAMEFGEVFRLPQDPIDLGVMARRMRLPDTQFEAVRTLSSNLDNAIAVLAMAKVPVVEWPNQAFRRALSVHILADNDPETVAYRRLLESMLGKHAYAEFVSTEDVRDVGKPAVLQYINSLRKPDNAALVVVGNVTPSSLKQSIKRHLADWENAPSQVIQPPVDVVPQENSDGRPQVVVTHRVGTPQVLIESSCLVPSKSISDFARDRIIAAMVKNRLNGKLREHLQIAYAFSGKAMNLAKGYSMLHFRTSIDETHLTAALTALFEIMRDRNTANWHQAFQVERRAFLVDPLQSRQLTGILADELFRSWFFGWRPEDALRFPEVISGIPEAEVMSQLANCFGRLKISIAGDESAVWTAVAQARAETEH